MRNQNALLIIDAQYDFCNPNGALYVPGAEKDMERLKKMILNNVDSLDHICVTLDSHPVNDISHPSFWQDKTGKQPAPFTQITAQDIKNGAWTPRFYPQQALKYLEDLEKDGKFLHIIWPEHCLMGSRGAALDDNLMDALKTWTYKGKYYQAVTKGTYPLTEHFGIFMAQVPVADRPETQLNQSLIKTLENYQNVYLAGEAKSHCVATSLKQAMDYAPNLANKMIVVEDCMSDVPNMGHLGKPIYDEAKQKGVRFVASDQIKMN
ncbi:MAG: isochorismatase family protein [Microscillaceae bacterium]|jgi:nicotinamidase-related amidase|nr:isochorismatase family protein [Microscillaceae bacterium]